MNTFAAEKLMTNSAAYNAKPHTKEVTVADAEQAFFHVMSDGALPLRLT